MLALPDDVLFIIFAYCDKATLGRLCRVCVRFRDVASSDCLWMDDSRSCVHSQGSAAITARSCRAMSAKEKCRVSFNWTKGWKKANSPLGRFPVRYMPWLNLSSRRLWISEGRSLKAFRHVPTGRFRHNQPQLHIGSRQKDICRFAVNDEVVVTGECDGTIRGYCEGTGRPLFLIEDGHREDVDAIDLCLDVVLTGSRDGSLKLWTLTDGMAEKLCIDLADRVWSVALNPLSDTFVCGTGGCRENPLMLFDAESGRVISSLGSNYLHGAGVLYCAYDNPQCLMSGGYDTFIRQWDTRSHTCTMQWENPHDLAVYCLASDNNFTFLSGSSAFGLVWLWDKRSVKPVQHYYVGRDNSPVYSLAFDPYHMYVALDRGIHLHDFGSYYTTLE